METKIIISGAGGQGILFAGVILAQAAMVDEKFTTYFPSYGAEIRGGAAMSSVIISTEPIGSPVIDVANALVVLNELSYNRYISKVASNGVVVLNSSIIKKECEVAGSEIKFYKIPASELAARKLLNLLAANMVMLGYYIKHSGILSVEALKVACDVVCGERKFMAELNKKAIDLGYNYR